MASSTHVLQQQKSSVTNHLDALKNEDLKGICRWYGEPVSGTKSILITRCRKVLTDIVDRGDVDSFETLKRMALVTHLPSLKPGHSSSSATSYPSPAYHPPRGGGASLHNGALNIRKAFKPSPFYQILEPLLSMADLPEGPEMPSNRHTVRSNLVIKPELGQRLRADANLKIMLLCGESSAMSAYAGAHIKFPSQIEVKVNNNDVKHSFKGLKNKEGTTKPADITSLLQKFGGQDNSIQITYALTHRRFSYSVYLVQYVGVDTLVNQIKSGAVIPKDKVIRDMTRANNDADVSATSVRMSLKDLVSTLRITVPVRSSHCAHNQCFDAAMFLQLQDQCPQWSCPVCNKHVPFESLSVDKYFEDILNRTSSSIEKVDIEPNGEWKVIKDEDDSQTNGTSGKARAAYDDDFDDLVELDEPVSNKGINGTKHMDAPFSINTPPLSSREPSVAQSAGSGQRPGSKRPQSAVIDLTLSDDEEPPRPAKRQSRVQQQPTSASHSTSAITPNSLSHPREHAASNSNYYHGFNQSDSYRPGSNLSRTSFNHTPPAWGSHQASTPQQSALFPPPPPPNSAPNYNASMRPPSANQNQSTNNTTASAQGGLRLPPMQLQRPPSASHSPVQTLYQGWRNGDDWEFGSYESSLG